MSFSNKNIELSGISAPGVKVSNLLMVSFLLVCLLPLVFAWDSVKLLLTLIWSNDTFSQIPLIPLASAFLIYEKRNSIFAEIAFGWLSGVALIMPGLFLLSLVRLNPWGLISPNLVSLLMFAIFLVSLGGFLLLFGMRAFRAACFPLLFLLFMIPIPEPALSKIIYFLQAGSSAMAEAFFGIARVPYHRQGFVFDLPGFAVRVAEECSGIRSTLALLITTTLAAYLFLKSYWKRLILCLAVVPIAIFKNGLRIATLSTLAVYVDPAFLTGNLHHHGGVVFFLIALLPLALLLKLFQKSESRNVARVKDA
jgi:exosortase